MKNFLFLLLSAILLTGCLADKHTAVKATIVEKKPLLKRGHWFAYTYLAEDSTFLEFYSPIQKRYVGDVHNVLPCYAKRIWKN